MKINDIVVITCRCPSDTDDYVKNDIGVVVNKGKEYGCEVVSIPYHKDYFYDESELRLATDEEVRNAFVNIIKGRTRL